MHRRRIQRGAAIAILAIMALLTLEGLGVFESCHDDCTDGHRHEACVCMCVCHACAESVAGIVIAPPTAVTGVAGTPAAPSGVLVPPDIFRPPLA